MASSAVMDDDDTIMLLFLLVGSHFRVIACVLYAADYRMFLSEDQQKRHSRRIPMCALVHMDCSSFRALYNSSHDHML
jgi:hypothetical protein